MVEPSSSRDPEGDEAPTPLGLGILGLGTVGSALVRMLNENGDYIARRTGLQLTPRIAAVRDPQKVRDNPHTHTVDDVMAVVESPETQVIVELMGGIEPAHQAIIRALELGKPVITANKQLIAAHGPELAQLAEQHHVDLLYEAAVGGGIPLVRSLRVSLGGEPLSRAAGILNGTTNYILTRMSEEGLAYEDVLRVAQELGYAEADPTADVEGDDAAAKASIIAAVAFGARVDESQLYQQGIQGVTAVDIAEAKRLGYVFKPLVVIERLANGAKQPDKKRRISVGVHPTLVPKDHPLASVRLANNALFLDGDAAGEIMLYGPGAGGNPTASAVLGDVIEAAHNVLLGAPERMPNVGEAAVCPIGEHASAFCLTLDVRDQPGVLAEVATVFAKQNVSIRAMEQISSEVGARLVLITHRARYADVQDVTVQLQRLGAVAKIGTVWHVLEDDE